MAATSEWGGCNNWPVSLDPTMRLRSATSEDAAFIVEMARYACVIEDWPLPDADSEEVQSVLPPSGEVPIVAVDAAGFWVGAVWLFHNDPPLRADAAGASLPELCIGVAPGIRRGGVGAHCWTRYSRVAQGPSKLCARTFTFEIPRKNSTNARGFV